VAAKKKPKKHNNRNKPRGHFCKVCGEHKANEKFSGSGHAAHICKKCAALPVAERNEQAMLNRIEGMAFRYLSESEIAWLRGKMNDANPEIREAARMAHSLGFPRYRRNSVKKGLTVRSLEFFIHGEVMDGYGDERHAHMRFFADSTGLMRRTDYGAPARERETSIHIGQAGAHKFLKTVVRQLDAPFWSEDLSDAGPDEYDPCDPPPGILSEHRTECVGDGNFDLNEYTDDSAGREEAGTHAEVGEPIWSLRLVLNKGGETVQTFYNQMHEAPQELFRSLTEWFEPEDGFGEDRGAEE
jgi:hypothetical protein